jgi:hypothetical protein
MKGPITIDLARAAAQRLCSVAGVTLLTPDHPLRDVIVSGVALASRVGGGSWSRNDVAERVSVTLPGAGSALSLLRVVPGVGVILAAAGEAAGLGRDAVISVSPSTWDDPVQLLATIQHELAHVGQIRRGGIPSCLAYLVSREARAAAEAPCYGASMAVLVCLGRWSTAAAAESAMRSLAGYGLDADALRLASGIVASARATLEGGEDLGGVVAEVVAALAAVRGEP